MAIPTVAAAVGEETLFTTFWTKQFATNLLCYGLLLVPAALIIWYTKRKYGKDPESAPYLLRIFALDHLPSAPRSPYPGKPHPHILSNGGEHSVYGDAHASPHELSELLEPSKYSDHIHHNGHYHHHKGTDGLEIGNGTAIDLSPTSKAAPIVTNGHVQISFGSQDDPEDDKVRIVKEGRKTYYPLLVLCFLGLQAIFLTWGIVQEKIVTRPYASRTDPHRYDRFTDSQFLVFTNKVSGFLLAALCLALRHFLLPLVRPPARISKFKMAASTEAALKVDQIARKPALYRYAFASLSNIMSSWCQYEALKYVTFPTQVLFKSGKIIPVMVMGKVMARSGGLAGKKYAAHEYVCAALVSLGISAFLLSRKLESLSQKNGGAREIGASDALVSLGGGLSGLLLLVGYVIFDSFTSNWQSQLFEKYNGKSRHKSAKLPSSKKDAPPTLAIKARDRPDNVTSWDMMCYVNLFSSLFTGLSIALSHYNSSSRLPIETGQEGLSGGFLAFALDHPSFLTDLTALSLCSALGQIFIFVTISQFGAVTFVTMMTVRQGFAVLLSCLIYGHHVGRLGLAGICLVFVALFAKIYLSSSAGRRARNRQESATEIHKRPVALTVARWLKKVQLTAFSGNRMAKRFGLF